MKTASEWHRDQVAYWNGAAGENWVREQARTDRMLAPVAEALYAQAAPRAGETVLDVGCGNGETCLEWARRVGPSGRVIGLDVSAPMLGVAKRRAAGASNIEFILADAAEHRFAAPVADLMVSRFGVMFFGNPTAAFANLKRGLKPGGRLAFACWRKFDENPWMQVPLRAAYQHVPRLPQLEPEEPGPFSFADTERVTRILTGAGWAKPRFTPVDVAIDLAGGGGLDAALQQATTIGPTSGALRDQPAAARDAAIAAIRTVLAPHKKAGRVALTGAIWLVESN
jgi:SAM-dependent methyltransferase